MATNSDYGEVIGFRARDFPISAVELRDVLRNLWVFPLAVNEPEKYAIWVEFNPKIAASLTKLIQWSEDLQNADVKKEE